MTNIFKQSPIIFDQEQMKKNSIDILAIGDIVVDDFIKIDEAEVIKDKKNTLKLQLDFGKKVPYINSNILYGVGNSPNAAVAGARLGLKTALLTNLGNDDYADKSIASLEENNVMTDYCKKNPHHNTNYHYVLWHEHERTILIKHYAYPIRKLKFNQDIKWIYLSSLGEYAEDFHFDIIKYLKKNPDIKLAFQPGTFQIRLGLDKLSELYKRCEYFCCNVEEAQELLSTNKRDVKYLLNEIAKYGPKIITITDGGEGAYLRDHLGNTFFLPPYPDRETPKERTGAGDAFTSTMLSFIAMGLDETEAILYAPINSMNVVQYIGAQEGLLSLPEIKKLYRNRPESYFLREI